MSGAKCQDAPGQPPRRLRGAEAWRTHAVLVLGLALCSLAFWFELGRAERGNTLSWAYVFEWPLLGIFAVYMWWKVLHGDATPKRRRKTEPGLAPEYDGMLRAWQAHQAEVADAERADAEQSDSGAAFRGERLGDQTPTETP